MVVDGGGRQACHLRRFRQRQAGPDPQDQDLAWQFRQRFQELPGGGDVDQVMRLRLEPLRTLGRDVLLARDNVADILKGDSGFDSAQFDLLDTTRISIEATIA